MPPALPQINFRLKSKAAFRSSLGDEGTAKALGPLGPAWLGNPSVTAGQWGQCNTYSGIAGGKKCELTPAPP